MLYDIETLCRNLYSGSIFFISCNYSFRGSVPSEKMESFKKSTKDFFDETTDKKSIQIKICLKSLTTLLIDRLVV